jgi:hypothetical protein
MEKLWLLLGLGLSLQWISSPALAQWSSGDSTSLQPVVQQSAQINLNAPVDPMAICQGFAPQPVVVDGLKMMRYKVDKPDFLRCLPATPPTPWIVTKDSWSDQDERNWENFVRSIGEAVASGKCNTVDTCLISSGNPYRDQADMDNVHYADCADFPMYLRTYFSYKNQLPMSFGIGLKPNAPTASQIQQVQVPLTLAQQKLSEAQANSATSPDQLLALTNQVNEAQKRFDEVMNPTDTRYSRNGNYFSSRVNVPHSRGYQRDFFKTVELMRDGVDSGSYRMLMTPVGAPAADFYSPAIRKGSIRPGTAVYNPTGHLAIVYDVTPNGDVMLMDAHPDNSLSFRRYNEEFPRSVPPHGAGFKNFRPFHLENVVRDRSGIITKGDFVFETDGQIPDFSLEQYFGNADVNNSIASNAKYIADSHEVGWYDYVKIRMANGFYKLDPTYDFLQDANNLCMAMKNRANAVQSAIDKHIDQLQHPQQLPLNIYGADGDWESYSTPGGDLRVRQQAASLIVDAKNYIVKMNSHDPHFAYQGTNLKEDLIKIYNQVNASCVIAYTNSQGQAVKMGLTTALKRMTKMSFDPYMCVEKRWGATSRAEVRTCADDTEKADWYALEQFLRNSMVRDPNQVMGWSLDDLRKMNQSKSVDSSDHSRDFDILAQLNQL